MLRVLFAALWGMPGPVLVGALATLFLGRFHYDWPAGLDAFARTAFESFQEAIGVVIFQAVLGFVYGFVRSGAVNPSLAGGAWFGAFVWFVIGSPIICCAPFRLGIPENEQVFFDYLRLFAVCTAHVTAGAIAGFHVDHYLLREAKRNREVTQR